MTGTVIHGTLRPEDLIPRFIEVLDQLVEESTFDDGADHPLSTREVGNIHNRLGLIERSLEAPDYYSGDDYHWDLEWLFDTLDTYSPEGHTFGAHPGDGSDFGFWPVEVEY